uniref:Carboxylic ester hydrolase n=1 Tax=Romanomermis culicivorax TaxID=13658 RepID=A0A915HWA0_ROMCU
MFLNFRFIFLYLHLLTIFAELAEERCGPVKVSTGIIEGLKISGEGKVAAEACGYLGVPYAESPIGDLRFSKTEPKKPWEGILEAKEYKPACWQNASLSPQKLISEDCLYMNIYVGLRCRSRTGSKCPVIFYVHGGAYEFDSVHNFRSEAIVENFASRDIVFVIFGYRLGVFGFWSTGTKHALGNWAFYDMIEALKWTKREIANFGGDPSRITVAGHSSGAHAAAMLTLTNATKGLFDQALIMSESASKYKTLGNNLTDYRNVAIRVGCWPKSEKWGSMRNYDRKYEQVVNCMRKVHPADLVNGINEVRCCDENYDTVTPEQISNFIHKHFANCEFPPRLMFPRNDGPEGLFPLPIQRMQTFRRPIKTMIGTTINEQGHLNLGFRSANPVSLHRLCEFLINDKIYNAHQIQSGILECKKNFILFNQFHERSYSQSNFTVWTRLQTSMFQEYNYFAPILRELWSLVRQKATVYLYSFDYERHEPAVFPYHSRDLCYVLGYKPEFEFSGNDYILQGQFLGLIRNFVKYGNPTPKKSAESEVFNIKWLPVEIWSDSARYLSINRPNLEIKEAYHKNADYFWNYVAKIGPKNLMTRINKKSMCLKNLLNDE